MATNLASAESMDKLQPCAKAGVLPVRIAILAKAPLAGFAKTRLIPALGARGAARLQRAFICRTLRVAQQAGLGGEVQLWCAPDADQRFFRALQRTSGIAVTTQPAGDLGARMQAATADPGLVLLVGTDCPSLTVQHLHAAADVLRQGTMAVCIPAEDGGYVLVGLRQPQPGLFQDIAWSTEHVMAHTRQRAVALGVVLYELAPLWDVDTPDDLARMASLPESADLICQNLPVLTHTPFLSLEPSS